MNQCKTCKWFNDKAWPRSFGTCHRYPPTVLDMTTADPSARFPTTDGSDYCGEHTPKTKQNSKGEPK